MSPKEAQIKSLEALASGDIEAAFEIKATLEGCDMDFDDTKSIRMEAMLDPSFQPKAFGGKPVRHGIRVCAAALELWGMPKIANIEGVRHFIALTGPDPDDVMLMWSAGTERARLREFKEAGITRVEVCGSGRDDDAAACRADADKVFRLEEVPELPHLVNTAVEEPCRCMFIAAS